MKKVFFIIFILYLVSSSYQYVDLSKYEQDIKEVEIKGEVMFPGVYQIAWNATIEDLIDVVGNQKKNIPKDIIYPVLKKKGIHKLDYVVIIHDDYDLAGGLSQLEELIEIEKVIVEKREKIILGNVEFKSNTAGYYWSVLIINLI